MRCGNEYFNDWPCPLMDSVCLVLLQLDHEGNEKDPRREFKFLVQMPVSCFGRLGNADIVNTWYFT
jgi:hypothetical protein